MEYGPLVKALNYFEKMQVEVRACGNLKSNIIGQKIHFQILLAGYENDRFIASGCYEYYWHGINKRYVIACVRILVLGAFVAGSRDLSFNLQGYMVVLLSNLTTAIYLSIISHFGKTSGLNSFGLCGVMV